MARYLWQVSYSPEGIRGLIKEGGTNRATAIRRLAESHGGKVESFDFAFGDDDVYLIAELPSHIEASAIALAVAASGAASIKTVVLLTPAEIDEAVKVDVGYRAPGK